MPNRMQPQSINLDGELTIASTRLPNGVLTVVDDLARRRVSTRSQILRTIIVDALTAATIS